MRRWRVLRSIGNYHYFSGADHPLFRHEFSNKVTETLFSMYPDEKLVHVKPRHQVQWNLLINTSKICWLLGGFCMWVNEKVYNKTCKDKNWKLWHFLTTVTLWKLVKATAKINIFSRKILYRWRKFKWKQIYVDV